jgi:hypothetical protein
MVRSALAVEDVRQLSERVALEYAGAVPPGRVLACALRVQQRLAYLRLGRELHRALLERAVRERLMMYAARPAGDVVLGGAEYSRELARKWPRGSPRMRFPGAPADPEGRRRRRDRGRA